MEDKDDFLDNPQFGGPMTESETFEKRADRISQTEVTTEEDSRKRSTELFRLGLHLRFHQQFKKSIWCFSEAILLEDKGTYLSTHADYIAEWLPKIKDSVDPVRFAIVEMAIASFLNQVRVAEAEYAFQIGDENKANKLRDECIQYTVNTPKKCVAIINTYPNAPAKELFFFYRNKANSEEAMGKDTLSDFNKLVEIAPKSFAGYWFRAKYYERRGQYNASMNDWQSFLDLYYVDGRHYGFACYSMAYVCAMLKKEEEGQKWFQKGNTWENSFLDIKDPSVVEGLMNKKEKAGQLLANQKNSCSVCGKVVDVIKKCSACKKAYYCSEQCQRAGWKSHKRQCTYKSQQ